MLREELLYGELEELFVERQELAHYEWVLRTPARQLWKEHKLGSIDEIAYKVAHFGRKNRKRGRLQANVALLDSVIQEKGDIADISASSLAGMLRDVKPNPATFLSVSKFGKDMRRRRYMRMSHDKSRTVRMGVYQRASAFRGEISASFANMCERASRFGNFVLDNAVLGVGIGLIATTAFFGTRWINSSKAYVPVAEQYVNSISYGADALQLKRDTQENGNLARALLVNWPEIDGDDVYIPGKPAQPQAALPFLYAAKDVAAQILDPWKVDSYEHLTSEDEAALERHRSRISEAYDTAIRPLIGRQSDDWPFFPDRRRIKEAHETVLDAVDVFEQYMEPSVVSAENSAHDKKTQSKWTTIIFGIFGAIATYNGIQKARFGRGWNTYYS